MSRTRLKTYVIALFALFIAGTIIAFPKISVEASLSGLKMWWNIVFPSLLPFFIVAELLIGFGVVTFIGALLEPIMRPVFKVPGVGGFVLVMGMASGFPAGAKMTARLYEEKKLSKIEAERLAGFTNFSNPLFLFGAIAIGFFKKPELGIVLALSHYIGNLLVGLCMRFYKGNEALRSKEKDQRRSFIFSPKNIIRAFDAMHQERIKQKKPFGKMLGDAVQSSVSTLLMVGGFIILFSVFNRILDAINATELIASFFKLILSSLHMSPKLGTALVPGLFEITVGANRVSQVDAPLLQQVMLVAFILGFGGFSIQAQVTSILSDVRLSVKPFFVGRLLQGIFSAIIVIFLFRIFAIHSDEPKKETLLNTLAPIKESYSQLQLHSTEYLQFGSLITLITLITYILLKWMSKIHHYSN
ncbi:sporulation integral membrane protein YlbJ [Pullulanibacillus camelliae]|uniref:Sporulation integral membrane protein YlbJ n=1 Tax=Pullulanibacillus camelliae TaxID=1707096 RepID=A0A8J2VY81_9BACL|nr:sporulation integral membrane protein YlbJ [Pullulanibacillus camelliae]GGE41180.1 sporulation integral membrane protein YlbJ [Pullulanibacillus camelliae]